MPKDGPPSYWDYLGLDRLLDLQGGLDGDEDALLPDELHFIVVHQVFELWFKLALRELRLARDHLEVQNVPEEHVPYVVHHLKRVNSILRLCSRQFGVMETLTPQDFLAFRDKLVPASGFQSFQMREIEILLGLPAEARVRPGVGDALQVLRRSAEGSRAREMVLGRMDRVEAETSLRSALHAWLYRTPIQGSVPDDPYDDGVVDQFIEEYLRVSGERESAFAEHLVSIGVLNEAEAEEKGREARDRARIFLTGEDLPDGTPDEERRRRRRIRAALLFIESYRELPLLAWPRLLVDTVVELEELLVLFRTRHARMVERIIGRRTGTGGSAGVDYLDATSKYRIFTELWAARTLLLPKAALPELLQKETYGFFGV